MKRLIVLLPTVLLLWACASNKEFMEGKQLLLDGHVEEGLARLERVVKAEPGNAEYKSYLFTQRERAINQWLAAANSAQVSGQLDDAEQLFQRVLRLDAQNQRAQDGLEALSLSRRHVQLLADAQQQMEKGDRAAALATVQRVLSENPRQRDARVLQRKLYDQQAAPSLLSPQLQAAMSRPITLEFRDAALKAVFEVISRTAGINFVFDKDVRPDLRATIFVRNTRIEDAVQLLLVTNQLSQRVLSDNTVMIYPNNPAKLKDYQELVIRSFFLANAEAKDAANLIRALVKTRDVYVDDKRNLVVMRDTPEAVQLAEKLLATQDLAEPEAILEVEVLEVNRARLQNLGIEWPAQIGYGLLDKGSTTSSTTGGVIVSSSTPGGSLSSGMIDLRANPLGLTTFIPNPAILLRLRAQDSNANVLANPRIRVKNHEKAKIHIGDKVPVFTSTAVVNAGIAQSVSYLDVGVKLEVQPSIGLDDDVTIDVGLEVSSIVKQVDFGSSTAYQIGSRAADTVLRLRDGETQVLAGLIQDEDRSSITKVPGLGDLPLLGRLFSSNNDNRSKTEIVLLITPHIVHNLAVPDPRFTQFRAGTESTVGGGVSGGSAPPATIVATPAIVPPPPAPSMVPVPGIVPFRSTPAVPPSGAPPGGSTPPVQ
ncbi:secretin N-terminal domain-containing protein [Vogesella sp. GCM10023246]|uniref:Secretin N-terminal domain-containing protein n=1 Tax=Vogesella oryzagri TaxID=3160864 RepID=A0ABV1M7U5_9NEIS